MFKLSLERWQRGVLDEVFVGCDASWIVEAMKLEYGFGRDGQTSINNLSPSRIKQLLLQVVSKQPDANGMYVCQQCSVLVL